MPDGSLEKRYGYRKLFEFDYPPRAIWTGKLDGKFKGFVLIGNTVLRLDFEAELYTVVGTVGTEEGGASFFYYRSKLYLIDGTSFYVVTSTGLYKPYGYVPLVGKDWGENSVGEPYQSKNLLNDRARISYVIKTDSSAYLKTDENIVSIDCVLVNGQKIDAQRYSLSILPRTVIVNDLSIGDRVEICYQYPMDISLTEELLACKKAMVFGAINNSRPFLWDSNDKSLMYNATYVSVADLYNSRKALPESDELFFAFGHEFTVGDGRYPISAVSRHYDRLLIFTEGGAWMADSSACGIEEFPLMRINSAVGVTSPDAAATVANEPCTVGQNSIYRWTSNTDELDECNAYSISKAIDDLLPKEFFSNAFVYHDSVKGEILLGSEYLSGKVLVYNTSAKSWTVFEDIWADGFFDCGDDVGFTRGRELYVFDKECALDKNVTEICAAFHSNVLSFGSHASKHISGMSAGYVGDDLSLELYFDGDKTPECVTSLDALSAYDVIKKRLSSKRFRLARFVLRAKGQSAQKISSLCLYTRQDK